MFVGEWEMCCREWQRSKWIYFLLWQVNVECVEVAIELFSKVSSGGGRVVGDIFYFKLVGVGWNEWSCVGVVGKYHPYGRMHQYCHEQSLT